VPFLGPQLFPGWEDSTPAGQDASNVRTAGKPTRADAEIRTLSFRLRGGCTTTCASSACWWVNASVSTPCSAFTHWEAHQSEWRESNPRRMLPKHELYRFTTLRCASAEPTDVPVVDTQPRHRSRPPFKYQVAPFPRRSPLCGFAGRVGIEPTKAWLKTKLPHQRLPPNVPRYVHSTQLVRLPEHCHGMAPSPRRIDGTGRWVRTTHIEIQSLAFCQLNYPSMEHSVGVEPTWKRFAGACLAVRLTVHCVSSQLTGGDSTRLTVS
jgi:hypothetical protein